MADVEERMQVLGEFIRDRRSAARLSLRKLSEQAGISNPYLSQIERGLRKPSAEILQSIAKALRISAETLYIQAGILDEKDDGERSVVTAVYSDPMLNERQKQVLVDIYDSFRRENRLEGEGTVDTAVDATGPGAPGDDAPDASDAPDGRATRDNGLAASVADA
jgi:transcriptional regulator with XRE-family HTH domain